MLSENAWSLTHFYLDLCRAALVAASATTDSHCANARSRISNYWAMDPSVATARLLAHLVQTGALLDPVAPTLLSDLGTENLSFANVFPTTRVFILLCTLSYNPSTFTSLVRLFSTPLPTPTKQVILAALCQRPDPNLFFTHVLSELAPVPEHVLRAPIASRAKLAENEDVIHQLLPHLDLGSLHVLLFPTTLPKAPALVKVNALILTHVFQRSVARDVDGAVVEPKVKWKGRNDMAKSYIQALQEIEGDGNEAAGERRRELGEAWEVWRQQENKGTPGKMCLAQ